MTQQTASYTLDPSALPLYRRRGIRRGLLIYGGAGAIALAAANRGDFSFPGLVGLAAGAAATLLICGLMLWSGLRSLNAQWATYELSLGDDSVARRTARVPDLRLRRDQITAIEEYPGAGLALRTSDKRSYIFIPSVLHDYTLVREQLATWTPLSTKQNQNQLLLRCLGAAAVPMLALVALALAGTAQAVIVIGALALGGALWLAIWVQRSAMYQRWFKIMTWCVLPLILLIIAQRLQVLG